MRPSRRLAGCLAAVLAALSVLGACAVAGAGSTAVADVVAAEPGSYVPLGPARLLDTRTGLGGTVLPGGRALQLQVLGRDGVPAQSVSSVVLNVTVVTPASLGYLTVYGDQTPRPTVSNLNFIAGQTVPNLVLAPVGPDGKVDLFNGSAGTVQLVADVTGYFVAGAGTPTAAGAYVPVTPTRLLDTRIKLGGSVALPEGTQGSTVALKVVGPLVPATATAVVLNVTAVVASRPGFLTVWPAGQTQPVTSNLNFTAGQTVPNLVVAPIGIGGVVDLFNGSAGSTQLVADISGYFLGGTASAVGTLTSVGPIRLLDTRAAIGTADFVPIPAHGTLTLAVTGRDAVPASGVSAVLLNVTAADARAGAFLTVYPAAAPRPTASNLNFATGQQVANLVVAPLSGGSQLDIYNGSAGTVDVIADVTGYLLATAGTAPVPPVVLGCNYPGQQLIAEPTDGTVGTCGGEGLPSVLYDLVWSSWTETSADGTGFVETDPGAQEADQAVGLHASVPQTLSCGTFFTKLTLTATNGTLPSVYGTGNDTYQGQPAETLAIPGSCATQ